MKQDVEDTHPNVLIHTIKVHIHHSNFNSLFSLVVYDMLFINILGILIT